MSDRLHEIKERLDDLRRDYGLPRMIEDVRWLVAEVERLEAEVERRAQENAALQDRTNRSVGFMLDAAIQMGLIGYGADSRLPEKEVGHQ